MCKECGDEFNSKSDLTTHVKEHSVDLQRLLINKNKTNLINSDETINKQMFPNTLTLSRSNIGILPHHLLPKTPIDNNNNIQNTFGQNRTWSQTLGMIPSTSAQSNFNIATSLTNVLSTVTASSNVQSLQLTTVPEQIENGTILSVPGGIYIKICGHFKIQY